MKSKIMRLFILLLLSLFLSSCLSLKSGLAHEGSGSGNFSLEYRLNKKAIGIQRDSVNNKNLIPLPLNRNDFDEITALDPGITLLSFSETEDINYVYIEAEVEYESLNNLSSFLGFPIEFISNGNLDTLTLKIYDAVAPVSEDTQLILDSVFADDTLNFEFSFPRNIRSSTYGSIDGRTVTYEISLPALYKQSGFIWTLEW